MSELVEKVYGQWAGSLPTTGNQLVRAWCAASDPEEELPPAWWVARFREALPERKTWYRTHLYRAATTTEIDNGFLGMQWTTERADADTEARKRLRVVIEAVVPPSAILAVIGTEDGGTVLVDPWQVKTVYLSEDVRYDRLSTAPKTERNLLGTNVAGLGARVTLATAPKQTTSGKGLAAGLSDRTQGKRGLC